MASTDFAVNGVRSSGMIAASFDPALSTPKDHIRLALGDTDAASPLLADATINAKLIVYSYPEALAQLAESLIAEFGQMPDSFSESGGMSQKWGERIAAWKLIADNARAGKTPTPNAKRKTRSKAAVSQLSAQSLQNTRFRSD